MSERKCSCGHVESEHSPDERGILRPCDHRMGDGCFCVTFSDEQVFGVGPRASSPGVESAEVLAKDIAARAVQSLADSEPTEEAMDASAFLDGTPFASMFVVGAKELEQVIEIAISNAFYDGEIVAGHPAAAPETSEQTEAQAAGFCGYWIAPGVVCTRAPDHERQLLPHHAMGRWDERPHAPYRVSPEISRELPAAATAEPQDQASGSDTSTTRAGGGETVGAERERPERPIAGNPAVSPSVPRDGDSLMDIAERAGDDVAAQLAKAVPGDGFDVEQVRQLVHPDVRLDWQSTDSIKTAIRALLGEYEGLKARESKRKESVERWLATGERIMGRQSEELMGKAKELQSLRTALEARTAEATRWYNRFKEMEVGLEVRSQQLGEARTALGAAEADTRRLDWLFADLTSLAISAKINRIADSYVAIHVRTPETTLTFRSAIDAASQGASGPEEGKS